MLELFLVTLKGSNVYRIIECGDPTLKGSYVLLYYLNEFAF